MDPNPYARNFPVLMPASPDHGITAIWVTVDLPEMCPRSHNPRPGSTLSLRPLAAGEYAEVGAVAGCATEAAAQLVGGHDGVRDMEGAIAYIAQRVADLLGCPVEYRAELKIVTPAPARVECRMTIEGTVNA